MDLCVPTFLQNTPQQIKLPNVPNYQILNQKAEEWREFIHMDHEQADAIWGGQGTSRGDFIKPVRKETTRQPQLCQDLGCVEVPFLFLGTF